MLLRERRCVGSRRSWLVKKLNGAIGATCWTVRRRSTKVNNGICELVGRPANNGFGISNKQDANIGNGLRIHGGVVRFLGLWSCLQARTGLIKLVGRTTRA